MATRPNFLFIASKSAIRLFLTCSMGLLACAEERPGKTGQEGTRSIPRERTLVTHCSDINTCGGQIVDYNTFENCCGEGQPVVSGPYRLSLSVPQQRILTRRDDWWAAEIGFHALPEVEQLIAPLVEKYSVATYDTARTAAIMRAKGWRRDEGGFWAQDGARYPFSPVVPSNSPQPDLLDQLALERKPLYQQRLLAQDVAVGAPGDQSSEMTEV